MSEKHLLVAFSFFIFWRFYLFLERGKEGERKRNINVWLPLACPTHHHHWGPGLQPRHVPWQEIELVTFWFTGQYSIHWATPVRAAFPFFNCHFVTRKGTRPWWIYVGWRKQIPVSSLLHLIFNSLNLSTVIWKGLITKGLTWNMKKFVLIPLR